MTDEPMTIPLDGIAMLDLLAETIVHALRFGVAVVRLVRPDGAFVTVSVAGDDAARQAHLGTVEGPEVWDRVLAASEEWGRLRFLDHRTNTGDVSDRVPDSTPLDAADAWHPEDALFAPLIAEDGSRLGILSVDLPHDGCRPNAAACSALEAFALSAALAIEHTTMRQRVEASRVAFKQQAMQDPLTGLANRVLLLDRLEHALTARFSSDSVMALVFVDVDNFKAINDTHSHAAGDEVLKSMAARIRASVRPHDTVARWGGDEFLVLLNQLPDEGSVLEVVQRLSTAVTEPVVMHGQVIEVTASMGVCLWPTGDPGQGADELIHRADAAMYSIKNSGRNGYAVLDSVSQAVLGSRRSGIILTSKETVATAAAATVAADDAMSAARLAEDAAAAANDAKVVARDTASAARFAAADTVAAAAVAAAQVAALAAAAVKEEAASRELSVAAAAVDALETIAAELPDDVDPEGARRMAAKVAATVAADVIDQMKFTDEAAAKVARATALAAEAAALAAVASAGTVEVAANTAEESTRVVTGASVRTEEASALAVESAARVAKLAETRVAQLPRSPLASRLRRALEEGELRLHYQPMHGIDTGEVVAVEALLRWQHPDRGILPPAEFIAVAEGPHLLTPIGDWVIEAAVAQAAEWHRLHGDRAPLVWANVSCDQLGRRHLVDVIERLLSQSQLPPTSLGLEVTERQVARRVDDIATDLVALRELGVALAVDDFGTGYASLDYLRRFTFDAIKIDRSFVSGLGDGTDRAIAASIVALGHSLDLTVVAEGVETQAHYDQVKELGCDVSQGYLHQRPAPAETIGPLISRLTT